MSGIHRVATTVTAVVSIALAVVGLVYNAYVLWHIDSGDWSELFKAQLPQFVIIFHIMVAVCTGFYVLLLGSGIAFLRGRLDWVRIFAVVLICEAGYWLTAYAPWRIPTLGWSAAAVRAMISGGFRLEWSATFGMATTVANAGLAAQFDILFPLWGPILMWWVRRSRGRSNDRGRNDRRRL
jgi:hypothetical protein